MLYALIGWESSVDPRYMDFGEVDSSALHPITQNCCGIRVGPDQFRLVSVLSVGSSLVGGRVQFNSLLLRTDQTNT